MIQAFFRLFAVSFKKSILMDLKQQLPITDSDDGVRMPTIRYKTMASVGSEKVFTGEVVPIPAVLIEYLDKVELKVFSIILRHTREHGVCYIRIETLAKNLDVTPVSIANATSRLRKMNIIKYNSRGRKREKTINFEAIQKLGDYLKDKKPGATIALRKKNGLQDIEKISPYVIEVINAKYSWHDDPEEDEEYD